MQVSSHLPLFNQFMSFYGFKTGMLKLQVHGHLKYNKDISFWRMYLGFYICQHILSTFSVSLLTRDSQPTSPNECMFSKSE